MLHMVLCMHADKQVFSNAGHIVAKDGTIRSRSETISPLTFLYPVSNSCRDNWLASCFRTEARLEA